MKIERFKAQIDGLQRNNRYNVAMFGTGDKVGGLNIRGINVTLQHCLAKVSLQ